MEERGEHVINEGEESSGNYDETKEHACTLRVREAKKGTEHAAWFVFDSDANREKRCLH